MRGLTISLLVNLVKSRTGFTRELGRNVNKTLRAFVNGPFGIRHDFGNYGTVIMVATGIGIAGLKELINGYNSYEVRTRRKLLIWQIQKECKFTDP
jgi:predicted ferric reductase